jgi:hypothetical protein
MFFLALLLLIASTNAYMVPRMVFGDMLKKVSFGKPVTIPIEFQRQDVNYTNIISSNI